jgi:hypothetical protein
MTKGIYTSSGSVGMGFVFVTWMALATLVP